MVTNYGCFRVAFSISALQKIGKVFNPKDGSKSTLQFSIFNNTKAIDPYIWIVK